ncbi:conserved domain protein [Coleofasciculus chthonoplastes PCC 7420]|uniref:Conserved domain protein n=2 Tax=Coleofasciculus chthonoplastes TaxID=64178 RepID=B4W2L4_9CYAN|nr:conserved domain protein [Coleofasciculus chthonoplastes PCC 7420]
MISAIPSQPTSASAQCLCSYANTTSSLQVIRIGNPSAYSFERIVFPGDRLLFEAASDAQLEVLSTYLGQAIKIEKIPCHQLQVELNQPRLSA